MKIRTTVIFTFELPDKTSVEAFEETLFAVLTNSEEMRLFTANWFGAESDLVINRVVVTGSEVLGG